jgi:citrate lyase beta subunit
VARNASEAPPKTGEKRKQGSLTAADLRHVLSGLNRENAAFARAYPGDPGTAQPVHTYSDGAHLFTVDVAARLGQSALAALDEYAPDGASLAEATGVGAGAAEPVAFAGDIRRRVVGKLRTQPVEDYRIDFEDGYGSRPDDEEDGHAVSVAEDVARAFQTGALPASIGIRVKPLSKELHARSLRTLDLFVSTVSRRLGRRLPPRFAVTIPKVMTPAHVAVVDRACTRLERRLGLRPKSIGIELMVETPQSILAVDGTSALRTLVAAGRGRVTGAHFGVYDYTALSGITASWQHLRHPVCDFARHLMQVALAQSGVQLSDGGTNVMPIAPHAASAGGQLKEHARLANRQAMHRAWRMHYEAVTHSLINGYYQGWDLHPAQLVTRYAAVYAFYQSARPAATTRLRAFVEKASRATLVGDVFDDAATGQALLNFFVRGVNSGALTAEEAEETGLTNDDLRGRSFLEVLAARR